MDEDRDEEEHEQVQLHEDDVAEVFDDAQMEQESDGHESDAHHDQDEEIEFLDDSQQAFYGHKEKAVYSVALHPTMPNVCCSGGGDDTAFLWDTASGQELLALPPHADSVIAVSFSADGKFIATAGMDGIIHVTEIPAALPITYEPASRSLEGPSEITCMQWHPRGHVLLAGTIDGQVWMFHVPRQTTAQTMSVFAVSSVAITACNFTADGKHMIAAASDGTMSYWDPKNPGTPVWRFVSADDGRWHQGAIHAFDNPHVDMSVPGTHQIIVTGGEEGAAKVVQLDTGRLLATLDGHTDVVEAVSICDCLPLCATASMDCTIRIWDLNTMQTRTILRHEGGVTLAKFLPNSPFLVSGSLDRLVRVWDCRSGECVKTYNGHQDNVLSADVNAQVVVSGGEDGVALVFSR